ncbi:hypothetical protein [Microvirga pudoricolor]|uniref:hypothetical protein n=1 Tax=Microvirga pudoricolor TaxID=2778729 RepID=UPI0019523ADB|nr:hypothetical protein [Microvirga pudoricolor]MBM6594212.1 hypothetical protein [Microvirga pudoricolor]
MNKRVFSALPFLIAVVTAAAPALAKDCPPPEPSSRSARPQGRCEVGRLPSRPENLDQRALKGREGFIDLGNGTSVRMTGRVRGEVGFRR